MRIVFLGTFLAVCLSALAQTTEGMQAIFPSNFQGYQPETDFESKELRDGTIRLTRKFSREGRTLSIKFSASSEENLDKNLADIGTLMSSLEELAENNVMTIEKEQGERFAGMFTFIARQQNVAGALFLVRDRYLLEIEIIGGESMEEARSVFEQIDLSKL